MYIAALIIGFLCLAKLISTLDFPFSTIVGVVVSLVLLAVVDWIVTRVFGVNRF
jgi:hypothetical protein